MHPFRLSNAAFRDLEAIWAYLAEDNPEAADRVILELHRAIRRLSKFPAAGHRRTDLTRLPLLFWTEGRYEILYRVFPEFIEIDAVLHGSRDIPAILREREEE